MLNLRRGCGMVMVLSTVLGPCAIARAQSAVEGFNPGANGAVSAVAAQSDGKVVVGGEFTGLGGGTGTTPRSYIGRVNADGSIDASFDPGADGFVNTVAVQPDGKIVVGGRFTGLGDAKGTTPCSRIGRINPDGSVDATFCAHAGADGEVFSVVVLPNGKILVGGAFMMLGGGGTGSTPRKAIGRLNPDGSPDASFNPGANNVVMAMAVQPDGKAVVGGLFSKLGGGTGTTPRAAIGRLNVDGSLDQSFNPGANFFVMALAVQEDGKIVVGGQFTALGNGGTTLRNRLGRLNTDGSIDASFDPGADGFVNTVAVQPDGKILVGGPFTGLGDSKGTTPRGHIGRLNPDGSVDVAFDPGANNVVRTLAVQPDGKILVGGDFTGLGRVFGYPTGSTPRNYVGRLYADGAPDADFNPGAALSQLSSVYALAVQPDGKVLVGGHFTETLGNADAGPQTRRHLGRINADGSAEVGFDPGANGDVNALAVQADGKILVGGVFTGLGGGTGTTTRNHIGRLFPDGTFENAPPFNPGANGNVSALVVQPDGKILVGGAFTGLGGGTGTTLCRFLGRLNADGTVDTAFCANAGANGAVLTLAMQPDGKILVGGAFTGLGGGTGTTARSHIGRLNTDGTPDATFVAGANGNVNALVVQPDGKILVGGDFSTLYVDPYSPATRNHIGRLFANGSVDGTCCALGVNPGSPYTVNALALQTDGKILVGGNFTWFGGAWMPRNYVARLYTNNAGGVDVDLTFDPGAGPTPSQLPNSHTAVQALAVQADGRVVVGGSFLWLGGGGTGTTARTSIGRLTNTGPAVQRISVWRGGDVVEWRRSGAGPEVGRVTFEGSFEGMFWGAPVDATRVAGGWQLVGQGLLPANFGLFLRARGYYATGNADGSGSMVESVRHVYVGTPSSGFTDDPLVARSSLIKAVHISELRTRIDSLRMWYGLSPFGWTDASLVVGITMAKAIHVTELRTALQQAYEAAGSLAPTLPSFTDSPLLVGSTLIKAAQIQELRDAVIALEGS